MKKNHMLWMILACAIPLLIIILLPIFGIKSDYIAFISIILMFGAHLFMMSGHNHDEKDENAYNANKKRGDTHRHH